MIRSRCLPEELSYASGLIVIRYDKSALAEAASAKYDSGIPSGEENSSN